MKRWAHYSTVAWNIPVRVFGNLHFTLDYASLTSKVSQALGDSLTFVFLIIHSTNFYLNDSLTFFVRTMHGLADHFTSVLWYWAIKCPRFTEASFLLLYALDILNWSKSLIKWTSFWYFSLMEMTQWTQYCIWKKLLCLPFVFVYYQHILHGTILFSFVHVG